MDGTYITDVVTVPHPGYGAIIDDFSHSKQKYNVIISAFPTCTCPDFKAMETAALGKHRKWVPCKHLYYIFRFLCKMDYATHSLMHAPTFSYNEVMLTLELCGVVERVTPEVLEV